VRVSGPESVQESVQEWAQAWEPVLVLEWARVSAPVPASALVREWVLASVQGLEQASVQERAPAWALAPAARTESGWE